METSISERREKEVRECVFVVMKLSSVCGVRNWSLMALVLFVKKIASSSAIRVDEGGQRREEKVLKSVRESEHLSFSFVVVCNFSSGDICREAREE